MALISYADLYQHIKQCLVKFNYQQKIQIICEFITKSDFSLWLANWQQPFSKISLVIWKQILQLLHKKYPLAYILGTQQFHPLTLYVNPNCLIPRPETLFLLEKYVVNLFQPHHKIILDVGTGSGAIAIFLKQQFPKKSVYGLDNSLLALQIANYNAEALNQKCHFLYSNLLSNWSKHFDVLIANLPYIDRHEQISKLHFEPTQALYAQKYGFLLLIKLIKQALAINPKALLFFEINPTLKILLSEWFTKQYPTLKIIFHRDFQERFHYVQIN